MSNYEKYVNAFVETLRISAEEAEGLIYHEIQTWDSVGHMSLVSAIEDAFDIMFDTEDIIDFSSFKKGKEILSSKYGIQM